MHITIGAHELEYDSLDNDTERQQVVIGGARGAWIEALASHQRASGLENQIQFEKKFTAVEHECKLVWLARMRWLERTERAENREIWSRYCQAIDRIMELEEALENATKKQ